MTQRAYLKLLGSRIAERRRAKTWSQSELGEKAGLSGKYISEIERGVVNASIGTLRAMADAFGVSVAQLVAEADEVEHEVAALLATTSAAARKRALAVLRTLLGA